MSSTVEQIKEQLGIADVIGSYLKLEKAGKNFKARCPFHHEKTPSFFVSPERNSFYCFGCGAKGDIFSFVEQFEGLDFMGALRVLGDRAGVQIERVDPRLKGEKERLFEAVEAATIFFEGGLKSEKAAREYLASRGVSDESVRSFRIGFARNEWHELETYLKEKGFTEHELLTAGLIKKKEGGGVYDTFRGRIIFPIMDSAGRPIAFAGRVFGTDDPAKYLNSPETPIFSKSHILFGYDKAKSHMRKYDFCILVEGPLDLILTHQASFMNAIAVQGTSLTIDQLRLIKRLTNRMVIALDADNAGIASAARSSRMALAEGFDVKVAALPEGSDPADTIQKNPDVFKQAVREAEHIIPFMIHIIGKAVSDPRKFKMEVTKRVLPFVALIENKIDQAHFIGVLSQTLDVSADAVYAELQKVPREEHDTAVRGDQTAEVHNVQKRRDLIERRLEGFVFWQESLAEDLRAEASLIALARSALQGTAPPDAVGERSERIFEAELMFSGSEHLDTEIKEMCASLEEDRLRERFAILMHELKKAERENDSIRATAILKECHTISQKIGTLKITSTL